jgi:hypothetical protein
MRLKNKFVSRLEAVRVPLAVLSQCECKTMRYGFDEAIQRSTLSDFE